MLEVQTPTRRSLYSTFYSSPLGSAELWPKLPQNSKESSPIMRDSSGVLYRSQLTRGAGANLITKSALPEEPQTRQLGPVPARRRLPPFVWTLLCRVKRLVFKTKETLMLRKLCPRHPKLLRHLLHSQILTRVWLFIFKKILENCQALSRHYGYTSRISHPSWRCGRPHGLR